MKIVSTGSFWAQKYLHPITIKPYRYLKSDKEKSTLPSDFSSQILTDFLSFNNR